MKLRRVDPSKIRIPETRVTARMDDETTEAFRASVETVGIDEPIKCFDVDGELWLSDGKHRLAEALRLKMPLVDITVRPGTMIDVLCNNLMSGHLRGKHPVTEMVRAIGELYTIHKVGIEDIVKRTGLTQAYVEKLIKLSTLTPLILAGLDEGLIGVGQADQLLRLADPVAQESAYHVIKGKKECKGEWLRTFIGDMLSIATGAPPAPSAPSAPVLVQCAYCGQPGKPSLDISNPNTCAGCMTAMHQSMAMARAELIRDEVEKEQNKGAAERELERNRNQG